MTNCWPELVLNNFGEAAVNYNKDAQIQQAFASLLAQLCSRESIPEGLWVDLGSGTGLLAEALETLNPNQSVIRVDGSKEMLAQHPSKCVKQHWDLNCGLPNWSERPTLIASNFVLHWLKDPNHRIEEWLAALAPGGRLALAFPVRGTFQEWHFAANAAGVNCTAMNFPCHKSLLEALNPKHILYEKTHSFTQQASGIRSLLKPIVNVGAHTTTQAALSIGDWRKLQRAWPSSFCNKELRLTWLIQVLLLRR
tara:strand:- start:628 stop:1383 length:756 start_codon:yes stop_codon:yes gene_type:complete